MPTIEEIHAAQRAMWDKFSTGWEKWDPVVSATNGPVGDEIIRNLGIAEDQHHLDVAAGTGEPGLSIAALAPRGRVVVSDISSGMLAAAQRRANAIGLDNVEIREASADNLPFEDGSFDSVSCRFGYTFFPDLPAATAELVASSSRAAACVRQYGQGPRSTRGQRFLGRRSRRKSSNLHPTQTHREYSAVPLLAR